MRQFGEARCRASSWVLDMYYPRLRSTGGCRQQGTWRVRNTAVRWVKAYPDVWFNSESRLTMSLAERGAFRDLQDYCSIKGSIPAETSLIAKILSVTDRDVKSVWKRVSKEFAESKENGRLVNGDATKALAEARRFLKKQVFNGRKGGRPKRNPGRTHAEPMGLPPKKTQALTHSKHNTEHNTTNKQLPKRIDRQLERCLAEIPLEADQ